MRHLVLLLAYLAFSANALAENTDQAFDNLASEYLSDLVNISPVYATLLGDHGADGQLDHVNDAARAETRILLAEYRQALLGIDRAQLSRPNKVDAELLLHEVE